jgi:hypothetical protein
MESCWKGEASGVEFCHGTLFFDLSGVTQSVVSAIGTRRNLGNDAEWKVKLLF